MKHLFNTVKTLAFIAILTLTASLVGCSEESNKQTATNFSAASHRTKVAQKGVRKYGIPIDDYEIKYDTIKKNQTVSNILNNFGFNNNQIHNLTQCPDSILNVRKIREGQVFALLCEKDSANTPKYVVYEESPKSYITFDIADNYRAERHRKTVEPQKSEVDDTQSNDTKKNVKPRRKHSTGGVMKYGLPIEEFDVKYETIKKNQTVSNILYSFGFNNNQIYSLTQCHDSIFNVRKVREGQVFALLCEKDDEHTPRYVIYEESPKSYITFDIDDNYRAERHRKKAEWRESEVAGIVESSLWVAIEESGASPLLAVEMSNIFGWSIDFFGIQKGDEFRIIYAQEYVENTPLNNYKIIAASFCASKNLVYAIPFEQDGEMLFYNTDGNSLEGAFLKAPLDYYRISSKFSNSRMHPVLKRRRAHHGVDYAAPKGTPVYAVGSGKVIKKAYQKGGAGNYLKIRHNSTYTTCYMHLSGYAKGLKEGDIVKQKQVIGYVGSTGVSTGPHLDFRVFENDKPIDPLTMKSQPKMPISKKNKEAFKAVSDSYVKRLTSIPMASTVASNDSIESIETE